VLQNALLQTYSADTRSLPAGGFGTASLDLGGGVAVGWLGLSTLVVAVAVLAGLQLVLARTPIGRAMRATSDDPETAALMGLDDRRVYAVATAIALATVALAGIFYGMRGTFTPTLGPQLLIFAFEAVIIGGLGSLWGTLLGGLVLGVAQAVGAQIQPSYGVLAGHLVFLVVLAARPSGLLRRKELR
jgi:branched-chain amino acid transport system permease protein